MNKKFQLFLLAIICCMKIQTSDLGTAQPSVVQTDQQQVHQQAVSLDPALDPVIIVRPDFQLQLQAQDMQHHQDIQRWQEGLDDIYGTSSSVGEIDSSAGAGDSWDTFMRIGCCPCLSFEIRHPKLYSCCCDNWCGQYIFACCMK